MNRTRLLAALIGLSVLATSGCASWRTYWFKSYEGKIDLQKDKILVLPISLNGYQKKTQLAMEVALMGGFISTFGKNAISLQPAKIFLGTIGLGKISYYLSWGVYNHLHWYKGRYGGDLTRGARGNITKAIPLLGILANKAVEILQKLGAPIPEGYKFTYAMVADMMNYGSAWGGKARKIRYVGGIVDINNKRVVAGTFMVKTIANKKVALVAAAGTMAKTLKKQFKKVFKAPPKKG